MAVAPTPKALLFASAAVRVRSMKISKKVKSGFQQSRCDFVLLARLCDDRQFPAHFFLDITLFSPIWNVGFGLGI